MVVFFFFNLLISHIWNSCFFSLKSAQFQIFTNFLFFSPVQGEEFNQTFCSHLCYFVLFFHIPGLNGQLQFLSMLTFVYKPLSTQKYPYEFQQTESLWKHIFNVGDVEIKATRCLNLLLIWTIITWNIEYLNMFTLLIFGIVLIKNDLFTSFVKLLPGEFSQTKVSFLLCKLLKLR